MGTERLSWSRSIYAILIYRTPLRQISTAGEGAEALIRHTSFYARLSCCGRSPWVAWGQKSDRRIGCRPSSSRRKSTRLSRRWPCKLCTFWPRRWLNCTRNIWSMVDLALEMKECYWLLLLTLSLTFGRMLDFLLRANTPLARHLSQNVVDPRRGSSIMIILIPKTHLIYLKIN